MTQPPSPGRFVLLCEPERQTRYLNAIDQCQHAIALADCVDTVIQECLRHPPEAILIDLISGMRAGTPEMRTLQNLDMAWPVLRANAQDTDPIIIVSTTPAISAPFNEALNAIAMGYESWHQPTFKRKYIRIPVQCRARIRAAGSTRHIPATVLELTPRGCFVVNYAPFDPPCSIEIEIHDIVETPIALNARVAWTRQWQDSPLFPGNGLYFPQDIPEALVRWLMMPDNFREIFRRDAKRTIKPNP
ncbi:MAG: PilZ domain-containing protein [Myxococcota bacterium]